MARSFREIINSDNPVVIDFHATWCGPCKVMSPILEQFKKKVGDDVRVIKIDVDKNPQLAAELQVSGVPTLMIFRNGKLKWRQSGVVPVDALEKAVRQA